MANGLFGTGAQLPRINQPRVQPAAIPGSTYVRPQEQQVGGNAAALADALGGLNSSLQNYADMRHKKMNDPHSEDNKEWIARRQQMDLDALRKEVDLGTADGSRIRTDALHVLLADRATEDMRTWALEYYNTDFDRSSGDFSADSLAKMEEIAQGLPEIARGTFFEKSRPFLQQWAETDVKDKTATVRDEINNSVVSSFRNTIDAARLDGQGTPEDAAKAVFEMSAQNRTFLGLSGSDQNATIFAIAQEYAQQGDTAMAEALLKGTRIGADGEKVPALIDSAKYSTKAVELIDKSRDTFRKRNREEGLDVMNDVSDAVVRGEFTLEDAKQVRDFYTDAQLDSMVTSSKANRERIRKGQATDEQKKLLEDHSIREEAKVVIEARQRLTKFGGIAELDDVTVPTKTGGERQMTRSEILKRATRDQEQWFRDEERKLVEIEGMDGATAADQIDSQRMAWYSGNNITNSTWQTHFNGLAAMANPETMADPGTMNSFIEQAERFRNLKAQNYAYADSLVTDKYSRELLETYEQGVELRGLSPEAALTFAVTEVAKPTGEKGRFKLDTERTERLITRTLRSNSFDREGNNYAVIQSKIDMLSQQNLPEAVLKERLDEWVEHATVNINGTIVPDHQNLPHDFPILIDRQLQTVFEERGEEFGIDSVDDLTVVPTGGENSWMVVSKTRGPIGFTKIDGQSLDNERRTVAAEAEEVRRELFEATEERRAAAQQKYDDHVEKWTEQIQTWRSKGGFISNRAADNAEKQLEDFIRRSDPKVMKQERDQREKQRKRDAKELEKKLNPSGRGISEHLSGPKGR